MADWQKFHEFEQQLIAAQSVDLACNIRLADELYEIARKRGILPGPDPLEGLDVNIRMVKVFRSVPGPP
jgi:hypothetical protein